MVAITPLSLPWEKWPEHERGAWTQATTLPEDDLDPAPKLAGWRSRTLHQVRLSVGRLIQWLLDQGVAVGSQSIAELLTEELLIAFIRNECSRRSVRSVSNTVIHAITALREFNPRTDLAWASRYIKRLERRGRQEQPQPRQIAHSRELYRAGQAAMRESADTDVDLGAYRDGLCVALLAAVPMRISNFATLEIGRHLICTAGKWRIQLLAEETKAKRDEVWPIPRTLVGSLTSYIDAVRPALLERAGSPKTQRLWIGNKGHPVSDQVVRKWITAVTTAKIERRILPHSFRHSAATTLTLERPHHTVQAASLLGHASPATTEKYYILHLQAESRVSYFKAIKRLNKLE